MAVIEDSTTEDPFGYEDDSMIRRSFRAVAESVKDEAFKEIYTILADRENAPKLALDSYKAVPISMSETERIKYLMFGKVKANLVRDGQSFRTLSEAISEASAYSRNLLKETKPAPKDESQMVKDGFYNPLTGVGVRGIDPGMWDSASIPVAMSPNEVTSYYSSGGLPQIIIDKKSKGALLNGYHFDSALMSEADRNKLKEYAQSINFDSALEQAVRDGLCYGGALLYPHFKQDNPDSYCLPLNQLVDQGVIDKNCIDYFVTVDRWNCIVVPNYDLTARDYLNPDTYYIPIGGIRLASKRCAIIKPKKLPYWGALRQLGWGVSDFEGYIRSILSYKIIIASVPIMAQQMSLLVHEIPLDGIIAQNGPESADAFADANSARMRNWSMMNPITINSFGKLTAINRSFAEYSDLIMSLRQDVSANCGIPESVLFHTMSKGFSDNTEEITLKQSETIKNVNNSILPSLQPIVKILVYSCFGKNSEQARVCDSVRLSFESPTVISNEEKGQLLVKFADAISKISTAGVSIADSVEIAKCFIPEMHIPEDVMKRLKEIPDPSEEPQPNPFGEQEFDEEGNPIDEEEEDEDGNTFPRVKSKGPSDNDDVTNPKGNLDMNRAVPVREYKRFDSKGVAHRVRTYTRGR